MRWLVVIAIVLAADNALTVALLGFAGVAVTAGAGYLVKRWGSSGDVKQTSSDKLWDVADGMRKDLAEALEKAYAREDKFRDRIADQDKRIAAQDQRIAAQDQRIRDLEAEVDLLRRGTPG